MLQGDPENPLRHDAVASLYLDAGTVRRGDRRVPRSRCGSIRDSAPTHYNLGFALSARGRRDEAIAAFEEALRIDPDYAQAHNNLGALLQIAGQTGRGARALPPRGGAAARQRRGAHQPRAAAVDPRPCRRRRRAQFAEALALRADNVQALAGLAWIRATASDAVAAQRRRGGPRWRSGPTPRHVTRMSPRLTRSRRRTRRPAVSRRPSAAARAGLELATAAGQRDVAAQFRQRMRAVSKGTTAAHCPRSIQFPELDRPKDISQLQFPGGFLTGMRHILHPS